MNRRIAAAFVVGVLTAGLALVFGADGWRLAGWGLAVGAVVWLRSLPVPPGAPPAEREPDRNRGRSDVDQLAWAMVEQGGRVRSAVLRRVAALAARPLADRGLALDRPADAAAVDALLGPGAAAVLQADDHRSVDLPALQSVLTGLERLTRTERAA